MFWVLADTDSNTQLHFCISYLQEKERKNTFSFERVSAAPTFNPYLRVCRSTFQMISYCIDIKIGDIKCSIFNNSCNKPILGATRISH